MSFEIITDSSSNLKKEQVQEHNIHILPLLYIVNGVEKQSYSQDDEATLKEYYELMRQKVPMSTSCACREHCIPVIEKILDSGKDLIYIGFSSALSATYEVISKLLEEYKAKYPKQKIYYADSLCASYGEGLLVMSAAKMRKDGASIDKVYDFVQDNKYKLCHLFTVDSLSYLYRGGRVKKSAYVIASTLNIKPVLHVNNAGQLMAIDKVFGRKGSLNAMAKKLAATIVSPETQTIFVGHGDCLDDAQYLVERIKELTPIKDVSINYVDLVVGVHSGPGTIAVFYFANSRET